MSREKTGSTFKSKDKTPSDSEYEIPFEPKPQPPVQSTETQPTEETKKSGGFWHMQDADCHSLPKLLTLWNGLSSICRDLRSGRMLKTS